MTYRRVCWCGSSNLAGFSAEYSKCEDCGTLVSQNSLSDEQLLVRDDEQDFYGKQYWLGHQQQDLGFPDIYTRARNDLTERNLHWLKTLMKYKLPPANVMELGCSHGSFVGLLNQAGFIASGVEMSPWVVEFGGEAFNVPIHLGPVESLDLEHGSWDAIVLMDVLEHLPYPSQTLVHCLSLLKDDGILLVQTPNFNENLDYQRMVDSQDPFLEQLKSDEHLYLFSHHAIRKLFEPTEFRSIVFEPAIFSHYDMCFIASHCPPVVYEDEQQEATLLSSPSGRLVLALLDIRDREISFSKKLEESEADRAARLEQIHTLTNQLKESEANRAAPLEQTHTVVNQRKEPKPHRKVSLDQINTLTKQVKDLEPDHNAYLDQIHILTKQLKEFEADREARLEQIITLTKQLKESEADREARLNALLHSEHERSICEADREKRLGVINQLLENVNQLSEKVNKLSSQVVEYESQMTEYESQIAEC